MRYQCLKYRSSLNVQHILEYVCLIVSFIPNFLCLALELQYRKKLFRMINEVPTINEAVKGNAKSSSKEEESEEDDEFSGVLCGACGANDDPNAFWICCDVCEIWFHGMCVKITPAKAEHLREFKCPGCTCK